jgi:bis(5'-nucleosyl)-tetraphosphatase (symmetrical)
MATYAIGDIQGCYDPLERLLSHLPYDNQQDELWQTGDLVNRGPKSLKVLRWAINNNVTCVLGNHELHLLARYFAVREAKRGDTLDNILQAHDCETLMLWIRQRPFVLQRSSYLLVHAGFLPFWTVDEVLALAATCSEMLGGKECKRLLQSFFAAGKKQWDDPHDELSRLGMAMQIFTRLRVCNVDGRVELGFSGPPQNCPGDTMPWFAIPNRQTAANTIVFGHWAALGLHMTPNLLALDSGCVWGHTLTAVRLEDRAIFQEPLGSTAG